jgi:hypothetical protein
VKFLICLLACGFVAQGWATPPTPQDCIQALLAKPFPTELTPRVIRDPDNGRPGFAFYEQSEIEGDPTLLPIAQIHFELTPPPSGTGLPVVTYNVLVNTTHRKQDLGTLLVALTLDTAMQSTGPVQVRNSLEKLNLQVFVQTMIGYLRIDCPTLAEREVPTNDPIYSKIMHLVIQRGAAPAPGGTSTTPVLLRIPWHEFFLATPDGKILSKLGYHLSELDIVIDPEKPNHPMIVWPKSLPEAPEFSITRILLPNGQVLQQRRRTVDGALFAQPADSTPGGG